jgi:serine phosphatase RsbU (regulator of sigma subunit)
VIPKSTNAKRERPKTRRPVLSIRWIVTLAAVALTTGAVLSVGAVAERNTRHALTTEIEARLLLDARNLALAGSSAMLGDYPELTLYPLAKELEARQPELSMVVIVDNSGTIQGHPDARQLNQKFALAAKTQPLSSQVPLGPGERLMFHRQSLLALVPVRHPDGRPLGVAIVGLPRNYLDGVLATARRQQTILLALFLLIGVGTAFIVMSQLLRPIGALRRGIERIGRGDLDTPLALRDRTELGLLAGAINEMAAELKRAQAEMLERERLAHEMELAQRIQRSLLPEGTATAGRFVIEGFQRAAAEVGGDYYDIFELPEGKVGVVVADVAGKGLAGCLVMSMVYALLRAYRDSIASPSAVLATLDARLSETLQPGSFVTMFYGVLDPARRRLTFSSAGHNPLILFRASTGRVERIPTRGIPLGAVRGGAIRKTLDDGTVDLGPGDVLLQYTDGVNEAFDPSGKEQFGFERMEQALIESAARGGNAVVGALVAGIRAWSGEGPPGDDETLLVIYSGRDPRPEPGEGAADRTDAANEALQRLGEARRRGRCLTLSADLDALQGIGAWLLEARPAQAPPDWDLDLLTTALYEVCANIVEHGYGSEPSKCLELWWIPGPDPGAGAAAGGGTPAEGAAGAARPPAAVLPGRGYFLVRDHGLPFSPGQWKELDFNDRRVRMRGRGLGLQIIRRATRHTVYQPATPEGNITLLWFGPAADQQRPEVRHVGVV